MSYPLSLASEIPVHDDSTLDEDLKTVWRVIEVVVPAVPPGGSEELP